MAIKQHFPVELPADPVTELEAANKRYVDRHAGSFVIRPGLDGVNGAGGADDTTAVNAILAAAAAAGAEVDWWGGTYLGQGFLGPDNLYIRMSPTAEMRKNANGSLMTLGQNTILEGGKSSNGVYTGTGISQAETGSRVRRHLCLDGMDNRTYAADCRWENCTLLDQSSLFASDSRNVVFYGNTCINSVINMFRTGSGAGTRLTGSKIIRNHIYYDSGVVPPNACITAQGFDASNRADGVEVAHNSVIVACNMPMGISLAGFDYSDCHDNHVDSTGFTLSIAGIEFASCLLSSVHHNTIINAGITIHHTTRCGVDHNSAASYSVYLDADESCIKCEFDSNDCGAYGWTILANAASAVVQDNRWTNNTVSGDSAETIGFAFRGAGSILGNAVNGNQLNDCKHLFELGAGTVDEIEFTGNRERNRVHVVRYFISSGSPTNVKYGINAWSYGTAAPTGGSVVWNSTERFINLAPTSSTPSEWVCTVSGTPGTWIPIPTIASAVSITDTANDFTATDVEGALAELQTADEADEAALAAHLADTSDAHDASAISILDAANDFTATDVEGALAELQSDHEADATALSDHLADTVDAHDASAISVDSTNMQGTGTTVQSVLEELDEQPAKQLTIDFNPADDAVSAIGIITDNFICGATIAIGDICYLSSNGKMLLADADAASSSEGLLGLALESGTDTQEKVFLLYGIYRNDSLYNWGTVGGAIYISTTPGPGTQTQPSGTDDVIRKIGWAMSADKIMFNPSPDYDTHT